MVVADQRFYEKHSFNPETTSQTDHKDHFLSIKQQHQYQQQYKLEHNGGGRTGGRNNMSNGYYNGNTNNNHNNMDYISVRPATSRDDSCDGYGSRRGRDPPLPQSSSWEKHPHPQNPTDYIPTTDYHHNPNSLRFLMLGYICLLNLLSDWTCYSMAPLPSLYLEQLSISHHENLIAIFFLANAIGTYLYPIILTRTGSLSETVRWGALLLCLSSLLKSGIFLSFKTHTGWDFYIAFFVAGLGKPLVQCPVRLFAEEWFWGEERRRATELAVSCHQLGVGLAYMAGQAVASKGGVEDGQQSLESLYKYLDCMAVVSGILTLCVFMQFRGEVREVVAGGGDEAMSKSGKSNQAINGGVGGELMSLSAASAESSYPDPYYQLSAAASVSIQSAAKDGNKSHSSFLSYDSTPTIKSGNATAEIQRIQTEEDFEEEEVVSFLSLLNYCISPAFFHATCVFVVSAISINVLCTFMSDLLHTPKNATDPRVGAITVAFNLLIVVSSIATGFQKDKRQSDHLIVVLLFLSGFVLTECSVALDTETTCFQWILLGSGVLLGPLQTVAFEVAVGTVPADLQNDVLCLQHFFGSLASAIAVPIFQHYRFVGYSKEGKMYTFSFYLLVVLHSLTTAMYAIYIGYSCTEDNDFDDRSCARSSQQSGRGTTSRMKQMSSIAEMLEADDSDNTGSGFVSIDNTVRRHTNREIFIDPSALRKQYRL